MGRSFCQNDELGNLVGWFGLEVLDDAALNGLLVNLSGYPGDKPFGTQWYMDGSVISVPSKRLFYMIDSFGGQSGSRFGVSAMVSIMQLAFMRMVGVQMALPA
jgi:glutamyl endopeptidase